jgi:serine phosphatase RsbU (regulator of sigma subunit)
MQCLQVWGGNQAAEEAISTTGLDVWLYCRPHGGHEAGGDVYYLSSCSSGRTTRIALADVSGHGARVADFSSTLRSLMQRHIDRIDQARLVQKVNKGFVSVGGAGIFATALIGTFFVPTGTFSWTNAGHPTPLLFDGQKKAWRAAGYTAPTGRLTDVALGIFDETDYAQMSATLATDDLVLWFTDGLSEAVDEQGEMLGADGLLRVLAPMSDVPAEEIIPELLRRVGAMCETNLSDDDLTVMLLGPNGMRVALRDNLMAPFRAVSNLLGGRAT